jgi:phytanoyl-CoA hydroxylase
MSLAMDTATTGLVKFPLSDVEGLRNYYQENGYVVIQNLIPDSLIDAFMDQYERIKKSKPFIYFSQSIHRAIRPSLNEYGFIKESMQNASRLGFYPGFSNAIKNCIYSARISEALTALDGHQRHVSWQDMFFDLSTGTIEHADSWYLDTDPPGSLVAAWFALEDIAEEAGTFFLMPGSHKVKPLDKASYPDHEDFRKQTLKFISEHGFKPKGMPLRRGDVILWHPFTIHGAFSNQNPLFSRKSFTSHYFPLGLKRNLKTTTRVEETANANLFRIKRISDFAMNAYWYGLFLKDRLLGDRAKMDMRRRSYAN